MRHHMDGPEYSPGTVSELLQQIGFTKKCGGSSKQQARGRPLGLRFQYLECDRPDSPKLGGWLPL